MTTATLQLNPTASRTARLWHHGVVVPWHAVRQWFAVFLITSGTLYASAEFNMLHGVFPAWVAVPLAVGIEWTYLSGLAYATELRSNRWSTKMIAAGALTSGLYGVLYILGHYGIVPEHPEPDQAVALALAHIAPLIAMLFLYTLCKRDFMVERRADQDVAAARQQTIADDDRARAERWRDEKLQIEIERDRLALERERVRVTRAMRRVDSLTPGDTAVTRTGLTRQQVEAYAARHGISTRTVRRRLADHKLSPGDILEEVS